MKNYTACLHGSHSHHPQSSSQSFHSAMYFLNCFDWTLVKLRFLYISRKLITVVINYPSKLITLKFKGHCMIIWTNSSFKKQQHLFQFVHFQFAKPEKWKHCTWITQTGTENSNTVTECLSGSLSFSWETNLPLSLLVWSCGCCSSSSFSCSISVYQVPILWPWGGRWGCKDGQAQPHSQTILTGWWYCDVGQTAQRR